MSSLSIDRRPAPPPRETLPLASERSREQSAASAATTDPGSFQADVVARPHFPPPLRYGSLTLRSRYLLAPLAGYTNLPFRRIVHELGPMGLGTTDLVNARALLERRPKTFRMVATHADDAPFSVQIFGSDPSVMCEAAQLLVEHVSDDGLDCIDINMGCPVDRITKGGAGSAMMRQACRTVELVQAVVDAVSLPVTVKMRLGWDEKTLTSPTFAREFEQVGVAAVMIHGRTRAQGFSGTVDLAGIRETVAACETIPVLGNGDVRTVADAARMLRETGCHGVSIGRGALANPWIFRQLDEWERTGTYGPAGTFLDRLALLRRQFSYLRDHYADDPDGERRSLVGFRKMAHWYLKAMRVRASLRHQVQTAATIADFNRVLDEIGDVGPSIGTKTGLLPDLYVPVPKGPVERW